MPIIIQDKTLCAGCEACYNACPRQCIKMEEDGSGFFYPKVNIDKCIDCNICQNICPVINSDRVKKVKQEEINVYACWSLDKDTRFKSTSGGLFSELARIVIKDAGLIVGAAYDDNCDVIHTMISDELGLQEIRQSKYTQSRIGDIFLSIKERLLLGKTILFCGAPCQVAGLKQYLRKEYENLITVDFICRGMNSPKAYRHWLLELESKYNSKATRVWFKYKLNGWKKSPKCTRIDFKNGENCIQSGKKNSYMSGYLGPNLYIRPSCSDCRFKSVNRSSDITLADFWGIAKELDDDQGTSLVLVNTNKGRKLFSRCSDKLFLQKRSIEEIMAGNACFDGSVRINPKSEEFLRRLNSEKFSDLIKEYTYIPAYNKVFNKIKRGINKLLRR
jgi:Coenzyme F420-reducing hydrogenase, beta subunit